MNNFKEKIINIFNNQIKYFKKYIISFILILLTTLLMVFIGFYDEFFDKMYVLLILGFILVFTTETYIEKTKFRIIPYIISFIVAYISMHFIFQENLTFNTIYILVGLYLVEIIVSLYKIIENNKDNLSSFFVHVFQNNIFLGIASSIIQTGLLFIVSTIYELLLGNFDIDLYLNVELLFLGLFLIPLFILTLLNTKEKITKFVQIIICYVILSIICISYTIIYLYFIKIFITFKIPSNQIFRIVSILFIFAFPTWTMIKYFKKENKFIDKVSSLLPILFIPFILISIYSIGIRIIQNGITISRYIGIILIIFEFITVILSLEKFKKYQNKIILSLGVLVLIATVIPYINAINVSYLSQLNIITSIYKEDVNYNSLSKAEKNKIKSAYDYIKYDLQLVDKLPNYINKKLIEDESIIIDEYPIKNNSHLMYESSNNSLDIANYSKMYFVSKYEYLNKSKLIDDIELNEFDIDLVEDNIVIQNKIKEDLKKYMINGEVLSNTIEINDKYTFYIKSIDIYYNEDTKLISTFNVEGYIFVK